MQAELEHKDVQMQENLTRTVEKAEIDKERTVFSQQYEYHSINLQTIIRVLTSSGLIISHLVGMYVKGMMASNGKNKSSHYSRKARRN